MNKKLNSRRKFILKCLTAPIVLFGGGGILSGCNSSPSKEEGSEEAYTGDPCGDLTGLSESEIEKREKLGYVEESPIPESVCANCQLYIPPKTENDCGGCMLFKGPVYADAYCTYWAPQV